MLIQKQYKFYAAHRNQYLTGKCQRLHGHQYGLVCSFEVIRNMGVGLPGGAVTTLFEDLDSKVERLLSMLDHRCFVDESSDDHLVEFIPESWKIPLPFASSAENVSYFIFYALSIRLRSKITELHLQETSSSVVIYSQDDFKIDYASMSLDQWFNTHPYWKHLE